MFFGYLSWFAQNYKAIFVPSPLKEPLGKMDSGIMTISRFRAAEAVRLQLPGSYSWPVRIFHLKRCALLTRIPSKAAGKDWCLINLHLSAFDDGTLRSQQLSFVKNLMLSLYGDGHYVVVGGDWNSIFPEIGKEHFAPYSTSEEDLFWIQRIPEHWTPESWNWSFDQAIPTCRSNEKPYKAGENFTTIIDGFLTSPNLEVRQVISHNLEFVHSDHNPVIVVLQSID